MLTSGTIVRVIGDEDVRRKLLAAAPNILAHNRVLVGEMLAVVKAEIAPETPLGPGHFGYHLRDTYRTDVKSEGVKTSGTLSSAAQGYWREFGTRGRSRVGRFRGRRVLLTAKETAMVGGGGEAAGMFANKALNRVRRLIGAYYGGMAKWWKF